MPAGVSVVLPWRWSCGAPVRVWVASARTSRLALGSPHVARRSSRCVVENDQVACLPGSDLPYPRGGAACAVRVERYPHPTAQPSPKRLVYGPHLVEVGRLPISLFPQVRSLGIQLGCCRLTRGSPARPREESAMIQHPCPVCQEPDGFHDQAKHDQRQVSRHLVWRPAGGEVAPWLRPAVTAR